jgi:signal transduction histidine kinase
MRVQIDAADVCREGIDAREGGLAPPASEPHGSALLASCAKIVVAQESERSRVARELHDDLGQQVALLLMKLEMATQDRHIPQTLLITFSDIRNGLRQLASAIHDLSHELYPGRLRLLGVKETLRTLCREVSTGSHAHVSFHADGVTSEVPEAAALSIVRVAQESLQNALKHSQARTIDVRLTATPSQLTLRVADDGAGFDSVASQPPGIGLLTMRERVELLGGRLIVTTAPGRGTAIEASVPLIDWSVAAASVRA